MMKMKYLFVKFSWLLSAVFLSLALSPYGYAIEKVGTTSMQVLKIPLGVRGIALGNALTADANDVEAIWWNPAAMTELRRCQVSIGQINMPADIQLNSIAYGRGSCDRNYAWSLHLINLFTDDMPVRTWERPTGTGENFNAYDFVVGGTYAHKLTDRFSLGANLRYLHSGLDDVTYNGLSFDLGTLYKTSLRSLKLAMAIQNLGPDVKYNGSYDDYRNVSRNGGELLESDYEGASLPTIFRLGVAFDAFEMFGVNHGLDHSAMMMVEMNHPNDNSERLNIGGEYGYKRMFFLRAGGKFGYDEESFSAGFGLKIPIASGYDVKFDYAYSHWGRLTEAGDGFADQPHRFQLGFELPCCGKDKPVEKSPPPIVEKKPEPKVEPPAPKPVVPDTAGQAARLAAAEAKRLEEESAKKAEEQKKAIEVQEQKKAIEVEKKADIDKLEPVFFDVNKSEIRTDMKPVMDRNIAILKKWSDWTIVLEGHADPRGNVKYNLELSERRMNAVKAAIVAAGISESRIKNTIASGEENPQGSENEASWAKNRRVDIRPY